LLTRHSYRMSLTQGKQVWWPLYMFVYHPPSGQRAYLGRFERTRVYIQEKDTPRYRSEVHYGLAFKVGEPEEQWAINIVECTTSHLRNGCEASLDGIIASLHCYGMQKDSRGWIKTQDLTGNISIKGVQIDALGKVYSPHRGKKHNAGEQLFRLGPPSSLTESSVEALPLPIVPKPLLSFAGKVTIFEPSRFPMHDVYGNNIPPPTPQHIAVEFDVTLQEGIYTVRARGMLFGVSVPVLVEDALTTREDYHYFLLHLFRRNSGRWETLLTYFSHAARALLLRSSSHNNNNNNNNHVNDGVPSLLLLPPPPSVESAVLSWPTVHRDHSYQIRNDNLYIHVRDGFVDARAPTILPSSEPWRLFLCDV